MLWGGGLDLWICISIIFISVLPAAHTAPVEDWPEDSQLAFPEEGCYYQYKHYDEGEQIITNEPCLNCTCHNQMLMCFLRVCPFIKPVGKDCIVEKSESQCCPTITCPPVPVELWTSTTLPPFLPAEPSATDLMNLPMSTNPGGCDIDGQFYMDGMKIPTDPLNPCDLCYCIRNHTACVMQECSLKVEGCEPIYLDGVCCPVKYICENGLGLAGPIDTDEKEDENSVTVSSTELGCYSNGDFYANGADIVTEDPCEHCYCLNGDMVCAVQECMGPLEGETDSCEPLPAPPGQCCPAEYNCRPTETTSVASETTIVSVQNITDGGSGLKEEHRSTTAVGELSTTEATTGEYISEGETDATSTDGPGVTASEVLDDQEVTTDEIFADDTNDYTDDVTTEEPATTTVYAITDALNSFTSTISSILGISEASDSKNPAEETQDSEINLAAGSGAPISDNTEITSTDKPTAEIIDKEDNLANTKPLVSQQMVEDIPVIPEPNDETKFETTNGSVSAAEPIQDDLFSEEGENVDLTSTTRPEILEDDFDDTVDTTESAIIDNNTTTDISEDEINLTSTVGSDIQEDGFENLQTTTDSISEIVAEEILTQDSLFGADNMSTQKPEIQTVETNHELATENADNFEMVSTDEPTTATNDPESVEFFSTTKPEIQEDDIDDEYTTETTDALITDGISNNFTTGTSDVSSTINATAEEISTEDTLFTEDGEAVDSTTTTKPEIQEDEIDLDITATVTSTEDNTNADTTSTQKPGIQAENVEEDLTTEFTDSASTEDSLFSIGEENVDSTSTTNPEIQEDDIDEGFTPETADSTTTENALSEELNTEDGLFDTGDIDIEAISTTKPEIGESNIDDEILSETGDSVTDQQTTEDALFNAGDENLDNTSTPSSEIQEDDINEDFTPETTDSTINEIAVNEITAKPEIGESNIDDEILSETADSVTVQQTTEDALFNTGDENLDYTSTSSSEILEDDINEDFTPETTNSATNENEVDEITIKPEIGESNIDDDILSETADSVTDQQTTEDALFSTGDENLDFISTPKPEVQEDDIDEESTTKTIDSATTENVNDKDLTTEDALFEAGEENVDSMTTAKPSIQEDGIDEENKTESATSENTTDEDITTENSLFGADEPSSTAKPETQEDVIDEELTAEAENTTNEILAPQLSLLGTTTLNPDVNTEKEDSETETPDIAFDDTYDYGDEYFNGKPVYEDDSDSSTGSYVTSDVTEQTTDTTASVSGILSNDSNLTCISEEGVKYEELQSVPSSDPCNLCQCTSGLIICAVQECLVQTNDNCIALQKAENECCTKYDCSGDVAATTALDTGEGQTTPSGITEEDSKGTSAAATGVEETTAFGITGEDADAATDTAIEEGEATESGIIQEDNKDNTTTAFGEEESTESGITKEDNEDTSATAEGEIETTATGITEEDSEATTAAANSGEETTASGITVETAETITVLADGEEESNESGITEEDAQVTTATAGGEDATTVSGITKEDADPSTATSGGEQEITENGITDGTAEVTTATVDKEEETTSSGMTLVDADATTAIADGEEEQTESENIEEEAQATIATSGEEEEVTESGITNTSSEVTTAASGGGEETTAAGVIEDAEATIATNDGEKETTESGITEKEDESSSATAEGEEESTASGIAENIAEVSTATAAGVGVINESGITAETAETTTTSSAEGEELVVSGSTEYDAGATAATSGSEEETTASGISEEDAEPTTASTGGNNETSQSGIPDTGAEATTAKTDQVNDTTVPGITENKTEVSVSEEVKEEETTSSGIAEVDDNTTSGKEELTTALENTEDKGEVTTTLSTGDENNVGEEGDATVDTLEVNFESTTVSMNVSSDNVEEHGQAQVDPTPDYLLCLVMGMDKCKNQTKVPDSGSDKVDMITPTVGKPLETFEIVNTTLENGTCLYQGAIYQDFDDVPSTNPCDLCYCSYGDVICAERVCDVPKEYENCSPLSPPVGECCPTNFDCNEIIFGPTTTGLPIGPNGENAPSITAVGSITAGSPATAQCNLNGTMYNNEADIGPQGLCDTSCKCLNGKVECEKMQCHPAPINMNCTEIYLENECCPTFQCVGEELPRPEADSHLGVTVPGVDITSTVEGELEVDDITAENILQESTTGQNLAEETSSVFADPTLDVTTVEDVQYDDTDDDFVSCSKNGQYYENLQDVPADDICQLCQCFEGEIICAKRECTTPDQFKLCLPIPEEGKCCPSSWNCNVTVDAEPINVSNAEVTTALVDPEDIVTSTIHETGYISTSATTDIEDASTSSTDVTGDVTISTTSVTEDITTADTTDIKDVINTVGSNIVNITTSNITDIENASSSEVFNAGIIENTSASAVFDSENLTTETGDLTTAESDNGDVDTAAATTEAGDVNIVDTTSKFDVNISAASNIEETTTIASNETGDVTDAAENDDVETTTSSQQGNFTTETNTDTDESTTSTIIESVDISDTSSSGDNGYVSTTEAENEDNTTPSTSDDKNTVTVSNTTDENNSTTDTITASTEAEDESSTSVINTIVEIVTESSNASPEIEDSTTDKNEEGISSATAELEGLSTDATTDKDVQYDDTEDEYHVEGSCSKDGGFYENLQDVPSDDVCELCQCTNGEIICAQRECLIPDEFKACKPVKEENQCCPSSWDCDVTNKEESTTESEVGLSSVDTNGVTSDSLDLVTDSSIDKHEADLTTSGEIVDTTTLKTTDLGDEVTTDVDITGDVATDAGDKTTITSINTEATTETDSVTLASVDKQEDNESTTSATGDVSPTEAEDTTTAEINDLNDVTTVATAEVTTADNDSLGVTNDAVATDITTGIVNTDDAGVETVTGEINTTEASSSTGDETTISAVSTGDETFISNANSVDVTTNAANFSGDTTTVDTTDIDKETTASSNVEETTLAIVDGEDLTTEKTNDTNKLTTSVGTETEDATSTNTLEIEDSSTAANSVGEDVTTSSSTDTDDVSATSDSDEITTDIVSTDGKIETTVSSTDIEDQTTAAALATLEENESNTTVAGDETTVGNVEIEVVTTHALSENEDKSTTVENGEVTTVVAAEIEDITTAATVLSENEVESSTVNDNATGYPISEVTSSTDYIFTVASIENGDATAEVTNSTDDITTVALLENEDATSDVTSSTDDITTVASIENGENTSEFIISTDDITTIGSTQNEDATSEVTTEGVTTAASTDNGDGDSTVVDLTDTTKLPMKDFCLHKGMVIPNLSDVPSKDACELCQCVDGAIVCALQECQGPPSSGCVSLPLNQGECCPKYDCTVPETSSESGLIKTTSSAEILEDDSDDYTTDAENADGTEKEDDDEGALPSVVSATTSAIFPVVTSPKPVATTQLTTLLTSAIAQEGAVTTVTPAGILQNEDGTFGTASGDILGDEYDDVDFESLGPGACLFENKIYVSAQQIPRDNPCDFCFCFRGDIICLQQSCPPPIPGCTEEIIPGFCCPRYECPVKMSIHNVTRHIQHAAEVPSLASWFGFGAKENQVEDEVYQTEVKGCEVQGNFYEAGALVDVSSGPCLQCRCDFEEKLDCEPIDCETQPLLKRMLNIR